MCHRQASTQQPNLFLSLTQQRFAISLNYRESKPLALKTQASARAAWDCGREVSRSMSSAEFLKRPTEKKFHIPLDIRFRQVPASIEEIEIFVNEDFAYDMSRVCPFVD